MSGFELADKIKNLNPDIPIIGFTAESKNGEYIGRSHSSIETVITKPYSSLYLHSILRNFLDYKEYSEQSTSNSIAKSHDSIELSRIIIESYQEEVESLKSSNNLDSEIVHRIKGSASLLGFDSIIKIITNTNESHLSSTDKQSLILELENVINTQKEKLNKAEAI